MSTIPSSDIGTEPRTAMNATKTKGTPGAGAADGVVQHKHHHKEHKESSHKMKHEDDHKPREHTEKKKKKKVKSSTAIVKQEGEKETGQVPTTPTKKKTAKTTKPHSDSHLDDTPPKSPPHSEEEKKKKTASPSTTKKKTTVTTNDQPMSEATVSGGTPTHSPKPKKKKKKTSSSASPSPDRPSPDKKASISETNQLPLLPVLPLNLPQEEQDYMAFEKENQDDKETQNLPTPKKSHTKKATAAAAMGATAATVTTAAATKPKTATDPSPKPKAESSTTTTSTKTRSTDNRAEKTSITPERNSQKVSVVTSPAVTVSTTTDSPRSTRKSRRMDRIALTASKTDQHRNLFDAFDTIKFSEVKIVNCVEKVVNITKAIKSMLDQFGEFIPFWSIISLFLGWVLDIMTFLFWIFAQPLRILVEAKDMEGRVNYFLVTDTRKCLSRLFGCGSMTRMELTRLEHPDMPLLSTRWGGRFCGCCCPLSIDLVHESDRKAIYAKHKLFQCCACECKCFGCCAPFVTEIEARNQRYEFLEKRCSCRMEGNVIEPKEIYNSDYQLAVKKNKFSCRDFMMQTMEFVGEGIEDAVEEGITEGITENTEGMEEVVEGVKEVKELKENADELQDALKEFRQKGYRKIGTTKSTWEVHFPPGGSPDQKLATYMFVLEQYWVRR